MDFRFASLQHLHRYPPVVSNEEAVMADTRLKAVATAESPQMLSVGAQGSATVDAVARLGGRHRPGVPAATAPCVTGAHDWAPIVRRWVSVFARTSPPPAPDLRSGRLRCDDWHYPPVPAAADWASPAVVLFWRLGRRTRCGREPRTPGEWCRQARAAIGPASKITDTGPLRRWFPQACLRRCRVVADRRRPSAYFDDAAD